MVFAFGGVSQRAKAPSRRDAKRNNRAAEHNTPKAAAAAAVGAPAAHPERATPPGSSHGDTPAKTAEGAASLAVWAPSNTKWWCVVQWAMVFNTLNGMMATARRRCRGPTRKLQLGSRRRRRPPCTTARARGGPGPSPACKPGQRAHYSFFCAPFSFLAVSFFLSRTCFAFSWQFLLLSNAWRTAAGTRDVQPPAVLR